MASSAPLRPHVTFQTSRFNQTEVKPHFINDICFGEDCAAWLIERLRRDGFPDLPDAWQEDWGWQTDGARPPRTFSLSIGLIPEDPPEWLVSIDETVGFLARLKGKGGDPVTMTLAPAIHRALSSDPAITNVEWHTDEDFKTGRRKGFPTPT
jgi:hypothetical protein